MIKQLVAIALIFNTTIAFADDVVYLNKGSPSPTDGYLFSPAKTQDVKNKLLTVDDLKAQNASYQKSMDLYKSNESEYQKQVDLLSGANSRLVAQQQTALAMSTYEKAAWFGGGLLASAIAFIVASKAIKSQ